VQASLDQFLNRHAREVGPKPTDLLRLKLQPLPAIHFADVAVNDAFRPGVDQLFVWTLALVAMTALFIAAVNYVNLSTARAGLRSREVALRKVLGATRGALLVQFLTESVLLTALAALLGLALTELALPAANAALGVDLRLSYLGPEGFVPLLAALVLVIGLGAGLYPAFVLARFEPASALAASRSGGGGRSGSRIREGLVALQFAISIAMIVCTAVIYAQTSFIRNADLGYQREGLMIVGGLEEVEPRIVPLYRAFTGLPGVTGVTLSTRSPGDDQVLTALLTRSGLGGRERDMPYERTGPDYFRTYGIRIVAGRDFDPANRADDLAGATREELTERGMNLILNERGARLLGFSDPREAVGATLRLSGMPAHVIGVAADVRFGSPREPVAPMFYLRDSDTARFAVVRYRGEPQTVRAGLEREWRRIAPATPFEAETVEQTLNTFYEPDERRSRLFAAGAVLAVAIGCIGLYGLGAFTAGRRTKEIGIRKVLGASTSDVLRLLLVQFLRPVVLANLLAWPLAFVLMRAWLNGFDQQIALSPAYFVLATGLAFLIALSTVTFQALQAARSNPIEALRHE
jgi:putative ABC transport system permease protein